MNTESVTNLLALLDAGVFSSGEWLGMQLGVTRAAVWKQLQLLDALGVKIESVKGKGYRLVHPVTLFDAEKVVSLLPSLLQHDVRVTALLSTESTNDAVKRNFLPEKRVNVCVADHQSKGRGRRGRVWESPLGNNCYYSLLWSSEKGFAGLEGLSLVVGLAVIEALYLLGVDELQLKWPNDVLWRGKKLAGILVEVEGDANGRCEVVIGVGINLFLSDIDQKKITQSVTDLHQITGHSFDKNKLVACLTEQLVAFLKIFNEDGFSHFQSAWNQMDAFQRMPVALHVGSEKYEGVGCGVDEKGSLLIETWNGIKSFSGGEVSLRPKNGDFKENC